MANTFRYLYGETAPVAAPIDTAGTAAVANIEIGDLVFVADATTDVDGDAGVVGKVYPASSRKWNTSEAQTRQDFATEFLGVAMQAWDKNNPNAYGTRDNLIRIATDGVFEFDCASASFAVGDLVGPAKDTGNDLMDQKVVSVTTNENQAIGRVVAATSSSTKVKVRITSRKSRLLV
jgi:hypothetical protein